MQAAQVKAMAHNAIVYMRSGRSRHLHKGSQPESPLYAVCWRGGAILMNLPYFAGFPQCGFISLYLFYLQSIAQEFQYVQRS